GRNLLVMQRQCSLVQPCNSRGLLRMSDIGLHRPDSTVLIPFCLLPECHAQRVDLKGITDNRAGCVAFDMADTLGAYPRRFQRVDYGLGLLAEARRGVAALRS